MRHSLIAVAAALIAMIAEGIYPFGTQQIAIIDMYHQYLPFLSELQDKLQSGGSLFFSWNGGSGSNFWNLIAYYGASPLNLLLAIFPKSLIMEAVTSILLLKIGLAAAFMAVFLRYAYGKGDTGTAVFAVLYALCSYVMAYYWCIMWMDAVMLLPLCMTGLHKLIDEGKFSLYTVSLASYSFLELLYSHNGVHIHFVLLSCTVFHKGEKRRCPQMSADHRKSRQDVHCWG